MPSPVAKRRQSNPKLLKSIMDCCAADMMEWASTGDDADGITNELLRLNWCITAVLEEQRRLIAQRRTELIRVLKDRHGMSWREIADHSGMSMARARQLYTGPLPPDGSDSWITQIVDDDPPSQ